MAFSLAAALTKKNEVKHSDVQQQQEATRLLIMRGQYNDMLTTQYERLLDLIAKHENMSRPVPAALHAKIEELESHLFSAGLGADPPQLPDQQQQA